MGIGDIAKELAKLSPEEKEALKELLAPEKKKEVVKKRENVKAKTVYFFEQTGRFEVDEVNEKDGKRVIKATGLPDRVIATDEKGAKRYFYKGKGKYRYLGRSDGRTWKSARQDGKKVGEAQALEYEAMKKNPDMTPPPDPSWAYLNQKAKDAIRK